jgi:hypothetical protein
VLAICCELLYGCPWREALESGDRAKLEAIQEALDHLFAGLNMDLPDRFLQHVRVATQSFTLVVSSPEAMAYPDIVKIHILRGTVLPRLSAPRRLRLPLRLGYTGHDRCCRLSEARQHTSRLGLVVRDLERRTVANPGNLVFDVTSRRL